MENTTDTQSYKNLKRQWLTKEHLKTYKHNWGAGTDLLWDIYRSFSPLLIYAYYLDNAHAIEFCWKDPGQHYQLEIRDRDRVQSEAASWRRKSDWGDNLGGRNFRSQQRHLANAVALAYTAPLVFRHLAKFSRRSVEGAGKFGAYMQNKRAA